MCPSFRFGQMNCTNPTMISEKVAYSSVGLCKKRRL